MKLGDAESATAYAEPASVYHAKWKGTWAIAIVHEASCVLSLVNDHGNWSNRWNRGGLPKGHSFHDFLSRCSTDYVLRKIMEPEQRERIDSEATKSLLREYIVDARRHGRASKEDARDAWDALDDWDPEEPGSYIPRSVNEIVSDAWECYSMTHTSQALAFIEMWPTIRGLIARTAAKSEELPVCPT